jgi:hypothetical protein
LTNAVLVLVVVHSFQEVQEEVALVLVGLAAAVQANGATGQVAEEVADTPVVVEGIGTEVAEEEALTTTAQVRRIQLHRILQQDLSQ